MRPWTIAASASLLAVLLGCGGASAPTVPAEPTATVVPVADGRADEQARRLAEAGRTITSLEAQVSDQEEQLAAAIAEIERWRAGLDKCVAKLNEVSADTNPLAASTYAPPVAGGGSSGRARVHTLGAPTASIVGDSAVVSVRLWNAGSGDATGTVELEIVCDGEVVDFSREPVEITARTDQIVTASLRARDGANCSAKASLDF